jgi:hypothetical protein
LPRARKNDGHARPWLERDGHMGNTGFRAAVRTLRLIRESRNYTVVPEG